VWNAHVPRLPAVLAGRVIPPIARGRAWAKLVGVYGSISIESGITPEGYFHFEPESPGIYIILIINESEF
jgi:hypothetical protein